MQLAPNRTNRFAESDAPLTIAVNVEGVEAVTITQGDTTQTLGVEGGTVTLNPEVIDLLMPALGRYMLHMSTGDRYGYNYAAERVSSRYTDRGALIAYGQANNDRFDDLARYPLARIEAAIQQAEEIIDQSCGRSFCTRRRMVTLQPRKLVDLPMVDAQAIDDDALTIVNGCQVLGVTDTVTATVTFGAQLDAEISDATTRLAAWLLRPKAQAENARGTSMDGVYISYDLATGEDGSWTGLPLVDAAIEQHRTRRVVIG